MAERMVKCVKFQKELPGLDEPPWGGELGKRIYENVSQQAWEMWLEHLKMVINEYRLNPATREAQEIIGQQMEHRLAESKLPFQSDTDKEACRRMEANYLIYECCRKRNRETLQVILHRPHLHGCTRGTRLFGDGVGDLGPWAVADDADPILGSDVQAGANRIPRPRGKLRPHLKVKG